MPHLHPTLYPTPLIGWREDVSLPDLAADVFVAKIDTGARMAALHAETIRIVGERVQFALEFKGRRRHFDLALHSTKKIKSSNGISELRPIVETFVQIGMHKFLVAISLTDRADMGVPMLLGREAIKRRFLVNPARSFILSRRKKK